MMCELCGNIATLCRIRKGRADYFCSACMNEQMDNSAIKGDVWIAETA